MTTKHRRAKVKKVFSYKKYSSLFAAIILLLIGGIFIDSKAIKAQISGLYNNKSDEVAAISALMSATVSHDVEGVRFFAKSGDSLVNQKNLGGATALHMACREKDFAIAQILIENKADVNALDNEGWTPLMRASLAKQADIVNLLLDNGAKADLLNSVGESAIYQATFSECNECLTALFAKVNFIKLMDISLLKAQLSDSYTLAQNHDNQEAQTILSNYLDQVVRMGALIGNAEQQTPQDDSKGKVFKFTSSKTGKVTKYTAKQAVVAKQGAPTKTNKNIGKTPIIEAPLTQEQQIEPVAEPAIAPNIVKKFKLVPGQAGEAIKSGDVIKKPKFKMLPPKPVAANAPNVDSVVAVDKMVAPAAVETGNKKTFKLITSPKSE